MEFFVEQVQMILPVLSFGFLKAKLVEEGSGTSADSVRFVLQTIGAQAYAIETGGEFVVLKGSTARKEGTASWDSYRSLRDQLVTDGKMKPSNDPDFYVFTEDVSFSSPSAAGAVVAARNTNGRKSWLVEGSKISYAKWQSQKIDQAACYLPTGE